MNRAEHLQWAKDRAIELLDSGDLAGALSSMISDLGKHPELENHGGLELSGMLALGGHLSTPEQMREHINGFN